MIEIQKIVASGELTTLSRERIWMETYKALTTDNPEVYFKLIEDCGALSQISSVSQLDTSFLAKATKTQTDPNARWTCLVASNTSLEDINNSFNVPKEYKEISEVCRLIITFKKLDSVNANDIIELADKTDIYRKEGRFLKAEKLSTFCIDNNSNQSLDWNKIVKLINDIKASSDLKEGKLIAKKLREDRLNAIQLYLSEL